MRVESKTKHTTLLFVCCALDLFNHTESQYDSKVWNSFLNAYICAIMAPRYKINRNSTSLFWLFEKLFLFKTKVTFLKSRMLIFEQILTIVRQKKNIVLGRLLILTHNDLCPPHVPETDFFWSFHAHKNCYIIHG